MKIEEYLKRIDNKCIICGNKLFDLKITGTILFYECYDCYFKIYPDALNNVSNFHYDGLDFNLPSNYIIGTDLFIFWIEINIEKCDKKEYFDYLIERRNKLRVLA